MDNRKMPYLSEEVLRMQRVEIYFQDLKDRLKELRQKHNEVIVNSVEIIKEIGEVASSLYSFDNSTADASSSPAQVTGTTNIKKLIKEFETAKQGSSVRSPIKTENHVNIQKIMQYFENLNDSHVLKESLMLFRKAKESFEKIDIFENLEDLGKSDIKKSNPRHASNSVRNKINLFNEKYTGNTVKPLGTVFGIKSNNGACPIIHNNEIRECESIASEESLDKAKKTDDNSNSNYNSCTSSMISLSKYHTTDNLMKKQDSIQTISTDGGYDGDNDDSEYNLLVAKKKKKRWT